MSAELIQKIRTDIIEAIKADRLVLPTLPEVALRIKETAEDPEASVAELASIISSDAAMTARIIRVCNSPLFRGSREITSLNMAVSRLGMEYAANLAIGLAMEQMFQATTDMIDRRMREIWQTSTEVAGMANVLAQRYTRLKPDQATLAGLVHYIGALPVLAYIEENSIAINNVILDNLIDTLHPAIGVRILRTWDFPEEIQIVPKAHLDFKRERPEADYADVVMVAKLQRVAGTDHRWTKLDWNEISAFRRLGIDPNEVQGEAEDLTAEMEAAMALLNG
ncbi:HDOD domain-containing protein [Hahella sp. SMD15-11]|uniref:HDOD domain-containing protein n=1 Tax=Thermohahella caldifontis TaxID=3142973 RepID=A0AB39V0P5_9GAMM